jgi:hypothetical protein
MARTNESAIQRLQVGLVGLLAVLICVSVASMILSRADNGEAAVAKVDGAARGESAAKGSDEAVVEIGVTPVVPEQPEKTPAANLPQN